MKTIYPLLPALLLQALSAPAQDYRLIDLGDGLLTDQLDKLVLQFKDSEPEFYNNYTNARVIVDNASGRDSGEGAQPQIKAA